MRTRRINVGSNQLTDETEWRWSQPPPPFFCQFSWDGRNKFEPDEEQFGFRGFTLESLTDRFSNAHRHGPNKRVSGLAVGIHDVAIRTSKGFCSSLRELLSSPEPFSQASLVNAFNREGPPILVRNVDAMTGKIISLMREQVRQSDIAQPFQILERIGGVRRLGRKSDGRVFFEVPPFYDIWYRITQHGCNGDVAREVLRMPLGILRDKINAVRGSPPAAPQ